MARTLRPIIALSCLLTAMNAMADSGSTQPDQRLYFTPSVTYNWMNSDWGVNNAMGLNLGIGKPVSEHWNIEGNVSYTQMGYLNGNSNVDNTDMNVDAMYFFTRNPSFSPFIEAGVGGLYSQGRTNNSTTQPDYNAGIGFMTWLHDIAIRADVRYRYTNSVPNSINTDVMPASFNSFNASDWIASVGLVIPLGGKAQPAPAPAPAPAPTPAPAPAPAPAPEAAPAPAPAAAIPPRPVAHTKLVLSGTNFAFNKASLRPTGKAKLDEDAKMLVAYPDIKIKISGYTDNIGSVAYNKRLSDRRANTVFRYLQSKGVKADRMTMQGYGKTHFIASNKTAAGRAKNRRVEIETLN